MAATPEDFLLEDYKQKISYLTNHLGRMWTRFNFFVTIESALIGGKFLIASNVPSRELATAGMILSALWYVMGAQDRYLVKIYRWHVEGAAKRIASSFKVPADTDTAALKVFNDAQAAASDYVGRVDDDLVSRLEHDENAGRKSKGMLTQVLDKLSGWRSNSFSITHLAAFYPLIAIVLWVVMLLRSQPLP
jgi:hypothetical protein